MCKWILTWQASVKGVHVHASICVHKTLLSIAKITEYSRIYPLKNCLKYTNLFDNFP